MPGPVAPGAAPRASGVVVRRGSCRFARRSRAPDTTSRSRTTGSTCPTGRNGSTRSSLFINDFARRVAVYQRTLSPWLRLDTIIDADNGRPMVLPNLTVDTSVVKPGEGTAITASDPTLGNVTLTPLSYKAMTYISWESWEDEEVNLSDLVVRSHARSISLSFGSDATTAILAAVNNGGTATGLGGGSTATFAGWEDLIDLKYSRAAPYLDNGSWVMSNGMIK